MTPLWPLAASCAVLLLGAAPLAAEGVARYEVVGVGIPRPLTSVPGDPEAGRAVFLDRDGGHCLLCHAVASLDEPFQGTIGPDLSAFALRMSEPITRLRLVDGTKINPDTVMPAYHRTEGLHGVETRFVGQPILRAQDIEDLIAYLSTLNGE